MAQGSISKYSEAVKELMRKLNELSLHVSIELLWEKIINRRCDIYALKRELEQKYKELEQLTGKKLTPEQELLINRELYAKN